MNVNFKILKRIICWVVGHIWEHPELYPTHGYYDAPKPGAFCLRCGYVNTKKGYRR